MAWAAFVQQGMQFMGGQYDAAAAVDDAKTSKQQGLLAADANEERIRANSAQQLGEQRARAAQSGFDSGTGSMAQLQGQSAGNAELDALTARYAGQLNAWRQDQVIQRTGDKFKTVIDPLGNRKHGGALALLTGGPLMWGAQKGIQSYGNSLSQGG
ncbi:MAG TPA: hypothetical protein VIP05_35495 [Burkholderiaceae bacterium]